MSLIATRMIGSPYLLGGCDHIRGFDCFSYWYHFYTELGISLPQAEGEFDLGNYAQKYADDPKGAKETMISFIRSMGEVIGPCYMRPADLCLFPNRDETNTAIYVGSGNLLTCDVKAGVILLPKFRLQSEVTEVRRLWPNHCQ